MMPSFSLEFKIISIDDPHIVFIGRTLTKSVLLKGCVDTTTCVCYDWSAVECHVSFHGSTMLALRMDGGGNYFNIFVNNIQTGVMKCKENRIDDYMIVDGLDASLCYHVVVQKRTEPVVRGIFKHFSGVTMVNVLLSMESTLMPVNLSVDSNSENGGHVRYLEFIGDSDVAAFGVEGVYTGSNNILSMKGSKQNIEHSFVLRVTRALGAHCHVLAYSGKGIVKNAPFCGSKTMLELYEHSLAHLDHNENDGDNTWFGPNGGKAKIMWEPALVVIMLGTNDRAAFIPPSIESMSDGYVALLQRILTSYPSSTKILCICVTENLVTSIRNSKQRKEAAHCIKQSLCLALEKIQDSRVEFANLCPPIEPYSDTLCDETSDWGILQHWSSRGQLKVAEALLPIVTRITGWNIVGDGLKAQETLSVTHSNIS